MRATVGLAVLGALHAQAFQIPFQLPFFTQKDVSVPADVAVQAGAPRVAIIGAGAGGSSAAFWIGKAKERFGLDIEVDVYEREDYIGGRSTVVYPYNDTSLPAIELGASIFVRPNKNMWRATEEFNISRFGFDHPDAGEATGIWNGEQFFIVLQEGGLFASWWQTAKVLWRYGFSAPMRARKLVATMVDQLLNEYEPGTTTWDSIDDLAKRMGSVDLVAQTGAEFFESHGVSRQFTREMIEAATRVNYGTNITEINGMGGAVSMAASDASSAHGGNFQIFEQFLKHSGARVLLNTPVTSITHSTASSASKHGSWRVASSAGSTTYAAVILAAPYHTASIALSSAQLTAETLPAHIPHTPYVRLHVTLLATSAPHADPAIFGLAPGAAVPSMTLTSWEGVRHGGRAPEFNSLSYHGLVRDGAGAGAQKEWAVKIFTEERVSDEWLEKAFGKTVGWVYRKEWDAYPRLFPITKFPSVKLDEGLYYVNAFEPYISTMETETLAARNVVDLLLGEHFDAGICGKDYHAKWAAGEVPAKGEDFVYGWDC